MHMRSSLKKGVLMAGRVFAIGDIHGCSAAFDALLAAIKPQRKDTIVTLGDHINRGPDSRGVVERLLALRNQCRLVPLLGNHEQMLLDVRARRYPIYWFLEMGGSATLDSYGEGRKLELIPAEHYDFHTGCLDYYESKTHIFLHANYLSDVRLDEQQSRMLRWESLRAMTPGPHESGKKVVVGHTAQKSGEPLDLGHLICIDTYCYGGGWLTALEASTGQIWQANQQGTLRQQ
jgi:serine/threonine protein phosphatase 1